MHIKSLFMSLGLTLTIMLGVGVTNTYAMHASEQRVEKGEAAEALTPTIYRGRDGDGNRIAVVIGTDHHCDDEYGCLLCDNC
jgi:hypothetical protein